MARVQEGRPPDRPVEEFRTHQMEHIFESFHAKALLQPDLSVNALAHHAVEFDFGTRIGRCTGSHGWPI
jgi:hypothetical protein